jgi:predicted NUDIX family NTP pyrophosphohydrolase
LRFRSQAFYPLSAIKLFNFPSTLPSLSTNSAAYASCGKLCFDPSHRPMPKSTKVSAGLLLYRRKNGELEFLLVHLGGPFWAKKDDGAWFLPKGEVNPGEDEQAAALREFREETGLDVHPALELVSLGTVKHKSGKLVHAWALEGDCDPSAIHSNTFEVEWPPRSGKEQTFPEIDRAAFFTQASAEKKMHPTEFEFVPRLVRLL